MNDIEQKRQALLMAYPSTSTKWQRRVKNMSEAQVIAIFMNFKAKGKI